MSAGVRVAQKLSVSSTRRKKAMVVSHERSGTHFLMNTLALNFGYISDPMWNLDLELGINFHAGYGMHDYFRRVHDMSVLNIVKSHHPFEFFEEYIDYLTDQFHVFYVYRNPRDVMISTWRLFQQIPWDEGPKTDTVGEFMRAAPRGNILRYQKVQIATMLRRWEDHLNAWLDYALIRSPGRMFTIRYEDLDGRFEATVRGIGESIEREVGEPKRPQLDQQVILANRDRAKHPCRYFTPEDEAYLLAEVGPTLNRWGMALDAEASPSI